MSAISEEIVEEIVQEKTPSKLPKESTSASKLAKEKLMRPKIPGFKKKSTTSEQNSTGDNDGDAKDGKIIFYSFLRFQIFQKLKL